MWAKDKQTLKWLEEQGPTFHMSLFHHHQITSKANGIAEPQDDEMIIFEYPTGENYTIRYAKLKELANQEQSKFIEQNDNKLDDPKRLE
jgi:hypothetical protein